MRLDVISAVFPAAASAAAIGVNLTIILDCVMTFFGSSANDAAFNAWLTESAEDSIRGKAEGINAMMPLISILVVFGGFMGFDLGAADSWSIIFGIIGTVVILIGIAGIFLIRDSGVKTEDNSRYFANIFYGFRPSVMKKNRMLYLGLLAFSVFNISVQVFMPYLILYYNVSLGLTNYVLIMAPAIVLAAVFTGLYGQQYDKVGFRRSVVLPVVLLLTGYGLLYLFKSTPLVFAGSLAMMCGYLGSGAIFGALIRQKTPANRAGMFQGLRIFTQVLIPGIIGPAIGAGVLRNAETVLNDDGTSSFIPNENIFLAALWVGIFVCLTLLLVFRLMKKEEE